MAIAADTQAEAELVASLLTDGTTCAEALTLPPDAITSRPLALIAAECIAQYNGGTLPDPASVVQALDAQGSLAKVGGTAAVLAASEAVVTTAPGYVRHLVERLRGKWAQRTLGRYAQDFLRLSGSLQGMEHGQNERTPADVLAEATEVLEAARTAIEDGRSVQHVRETLGELFEQVERAYNHPDKASAVMCGVESIDGLLAGVGRGQLVTVAAQPGMGKSLFAVWYAVEAAKRGYAALYESPEMDRVEIAARIVSQFTFAPGAIEYDRMLGVGNFNGPEWQALSTALGKAGELPLVVTDAQVSVGQIRADIHRARLMLGDLRLVVVDQLESLDMSVDQVRGQREDVAWGRTVNRLKRLAREEGVGILLLHQLRREAEDRPKHVPYLRDLADTAVVAKRSDKVVFLVRPAHYPDTAHLEMSDPAYNANDLDIYVMKHRNGKTGIATCYVDLGRNRVTQRVSAAQR